MGYVFNSIDIDQIMNDLIDLFSGKYEKRYLKKLRKQKRKKKKSGRIR